MRARIYSDGNINNKKKKKIFSKDYYIIIYVFSSLILVGLCK